MGLIDDAAVERGEGLGEGGEGDAHGDWGDGGDGGLLAAEEVGAGERGGGAVIQPASSTQVAPIDASRWGMILFSGGSTIAGVCRPNMSANPNPPRCSAITI